MVPIAAYADRTVAVLGLGRAGRAAARALVAGGARVVAWDDAAAAREGPPAGVDLRDPTRWAWADIAALVLSPGIPHRHPAPHPAAAAARAHRVPIVGEVEFLWRACPDALYVGITGTNGKSTTTSLIGHILELAGRRIQVGGNLGVPALDLEPLAGNGAYVLEMSSFQLELLHTARFDVAVMLNIAPDHLDRHGGLDGYVAAKRRVFDRQPIGGVAIVGIDDALSRHMFDDLRGRPDGRRVIGVSGHEEIVDGVYVDNDGWLYDASSVPALCLRDLRAVPSLPGLHNAQNAAAAAAATRALGLAPHQIGAGLGTFRGLPHRQEPIARIGDVLYVNDSKATNPDAAARALGSYDAIYWIAGGRPKEGGFTALDRCLAAVRHAFLIGEAAPLLATLLDGRVAATPSGDLVSALRAAHAMAQADGGGNAVVLLSPACASFDQFPNFEARGDTFRRLVHDLARATETAS